MEEMEKKVARTLWNYLTCSSSLTDTGSTWLYVWLAADCRHLVSIWACDCFVHALVTAPVLDVTTKHKSLWESTWLRFSDEVQSTHCCLETTEMSDSDDETPTDHQLKFVVLGDGASGKVSFLDKLVKPVRLMESYNWFRKLTVHKFCLL